MKITWKTVAPLVVWLVLYLIPVPTGLNADQWHYFALFAAVITGLILESMSVGAIAVDGVGLCRARSGSLRWMLSGSSTVWLMLTPLFSIGCKAARPPDCLLIRASGRVAVLSDLLLAPSLRARSGGTIIDRQQLRIRFRTDRRRIGTYGVGRSRPPQ